MRKLFLFLFLSLSFTSAFAQKFKKFSSGREAYVSEVRELLKKTDVDKEDELEPLLLEFSGTWTAGGIDDDEAKEVIQISNNFLKKRVTDYVSWKRFLKIITHFENNEEEKYLKLWLESLSKLSKKNPARFIRDYLETTYLTFYEYILFDNGKIKWQIGSGDYTFTYEDGPKFQFDGIDLWAYYKSDSTRIEGTAGVYDPLKRTFYGNGGLIYFIRAGLSEDSAFVELKDFEINVTKTSFQADSVILNTLVFLKEPLMGSFEERLTSSGGRGNATFPRFNSYRQDVAIKDIVPGADFLGGFSVIGSKFYGGGSDTSKATIKFNYEGKEAISSQSDRFLLRLDKIESEDVSVTIRLKEDSIYHPKITLRYLPETKQITIIRKEEGLGQTPFTNSYHNMDMAFGLITWKLDEPKMQIGNLNLGTEASAVFESQNYFRGKRFDQLRGLDNENVLYKMKAMAEAYDKRSFSDEEVARFLRMDKRSAHIFMMRMSVFGLVKYDLDARTGVFKDKVFDYINNYEEKRDYDVIQFVSSKSGSNATLSLLDYAMEIEGINTIALSDSQKVRLFPKNRKITVYENLNFDFDGKIVAGRFSYWGEVFKFNYDQFRINMDNIDSMRFKVQTFEQNNLGQRPLVDVQTVLQELTGELLIDDPNNKSGQKQYTDYPIFRSAKESYIYYDKKSIFDGVYDRSKFYVTLEPFEIDSLDNISTDGLQFDGTFTSAGIFPDLTETIKVQEDYSLGFKDETPSGGLAAYGGKGTYSNKLALSNEGLRGDGRIDYLNSYATSDEFFFFPDSTTGIAFEYEITAQTAGTEYPHAIGKGVFLDWRPYKDVLYTTSRETAFAMYDDIGMTAVGTLAHGPNSLKGKGVLDFLNAETKSEEYLFKNRKFSSQKLAFKVRANPDVDWGFTMDDARGDVNFDTERGDFYLNNPAEYFTFPVNQYICYMDYAKWLIPEKAINVKKVGDQASSRMISTNSEQDSLQFVAGHSKFYLENYLLESFQVPNIDVADASIFPDTGYVAIGKKAKMRTLLNASITANRTTKFHKFYGGTIDIYSRSKYYGNADYEYLDQDGTAWPMHFETVKADTGSTVGTATVKEGESFYMSPYFAYYGKVYLLGERKGLDFRGFTHIDSDCPTVSTDWFEFRSIIDPDNIVIDLPAIEADDKTKILVNGVMIDADTVTGYAAFLSQRTSAYDKEMFFTTGKLYYEETIGSYVIIDPAKFDDPNAKGNYLAFNNIDCLMHGEGTMSIGDNRGQMEVSSWGNIDYDLSTDDMNLDLVLGLDFHFSSDLQEAIADAINGETSLEGADLGRKAFEVSIDELLTGKDKTKFIESIENYGAPEKLPDEYQRTLLFSDIKLRWVPEAVSFLSEGDVAVGGLGKYPVNKKVKAKMEIRRKRRGDEIYMYLEVRPSVYFYFEYKRNQITFYTSNDEIMTKLKELDIKERRREVKGKPPFVYTIGTKGKMNRFLSRFEEFE